MHVPCAAVVHVSRMHIPCTSQALNKGSQAHLAADNSTLGSLATSGAHLLHSDRLLTKSNAFLAEASRPPAVPPLFLQPPLAHSFCLVPGSSSSLLLPRLAVSSQPRRISHSCHQLLQPVYHSCSQRCPGCLVQLHHSLHQARCMVTGPDKSSVPFCIASPQLGLQGCAELQTYANGWQPCSWQSSQLDTATRQLCAGVKHSSRHRGAVTPVGYTVMRGIRCFASPSQAGLGLCHQLLQLVLLPDQQQSALQYPLQRLLAPLAWSAQQEPPELLAGGIPAGLSLGSQQWSDGLSVHPSCPKLAEMQRWSHHS